MDEKQKLIKSIMKKLMYLDGLLEQELEEQEKQSQSPAPPVISSCECVPNSETQCNCQAC